MTWVYTRPLLLLPIITSMLIYVCICACAPELIGRGRLFRYWTVDPRHAGRLLDLPRGNRGLRSRAEGPRQRLQDVQAPRGGAEGSAHSQVRLLQHLQGREVVYFYGCVFTTGGGGGGCPSTQGLQGRGLCEQKGCFDPSAQNERGVVGPSVTIAAKKSRLYLRVAASCQLCIPALEGMLLLLS